MIKVDHRPPRLIFIHAIAASCILLGCETGLLQKLPQPLDSLLVQVGVMKA